MLSCKIKVKMYIFIYLWYFLCFTCLSLMTFICVSVLYPCPDPCFTKCCYFWIGKTMLAPSVFLCICHSRAMFVPATRSKSLIKLSGTMASSIIINAELSMNTLKYKAQIWERLLNERNRGRRSQCHNNRLRLKKGIFVQTNFGVVVNF